MSVCLSVCTRYNFGILQQILLKLGHSLGQGVNAKHFQVPGSNFLEAEGGQRLFVCLWAKIFYLIFWWGFRVDQLLSGDYGWNPTNGVTRCKNVTCWLMNKNTNVNFNTRFKVHKFFAKSCKILSCQVMTSQVILGQVISNLFTNFFRLHVIIHLRVFFMAWHDLFQPQTNYISTLHKHNLTFVWLILASYAHTTKFKCMRIL